MPRPERLRCRSFGRYFSTVAASAAVGALRGSGGGSSWQLQISAILALTSAVVFDRFSAGCQRCWRSGRRSAATTPGSCGTPWRQQRRTPLPRTMPACYSGCRRDLLGSRGAAPMWTLQASLGVAKYKCIIRRQTTAAATAGGACPRVLASRRCGHRRQILDSRDLSSQLRRPQAAVPQRRSARV